MSSSTFSAVNTSWESERRSPVSECCRNSGLKNVYTTKRLTRRQLQCNNAPKLRSPSNLPNPGKGQSSRYSGMKKFASWPAASSLHSIPSHDQKIRHNLSELPRKSVVAFPSTSTHTTSESSATMWTASRRCNTLSLISKYRRSTGIREQLCLPRHLLRMAGCILERGVRSTTASQIRPVQPERVLFSVRLCIIW